MREQLESFLDYLRLNRNASRHTVLAYRSDLSQFLLFLETWPGRQSATGLDSTDLNQGSVRGFLGELYRRGVAGSSSARKLAAVRSFARFLCREGILDTDPGALVTTPRQVQKVPAHLDIEEMRLLLKAPDQTTLLGRRDRAILEVFYASGLRLSELVGLGLGDINESSRLLRVLGKGGKERIVPFNPEAAKALKAYLVVRAWGSARTRCVTRLRPICSSGAPTCGRFRSSWGTAG